MSKEAFDRKLATFYREHPEARAAVERARADPEGTRRIVERVTARANDFEKRIHRSGLRGEILSIR